MRKFKVKRGNRAGRARCSKVTGANLVEIRERPEWSMKYLCEIEAVLDEILESEREEVFLLTRNVIEQVSESLVFIAQNSSASWILEKIIWASSPETLEVISRKFATNWSNLMKDQFASHVLQSFLYVCSMYLRKGYLAEFVRSIPSEIHNWAELVSNRYSSHLVRAILELFSFSPVTEVKNEALDRYKTFLNEAAFRDSSVCIEDFSRIAKSIGEAIALQVKGNLEAFYSNSSATHVLQFLVEYEGTRECMYECIFPSVSECSLNPDMLLHETASYFLEKLIKSASRETLCKMYTLYFMNNFKKLATHSVGNFVVQRFLECIKTPELGLAVLDELVPLVSCIIKARKLGVIAKMFYLCKELNVKQKELAESFVTFLEKMEHMSLNSVISLNENFEPNVQASLILQNWLSFKKPNYRYIVRLIKNLNEGDFFKLACNSVSSRVLEAFFLSESVPNKVKKTKISQIMNILPKMCMDKYASHVFDKCWMISEVRVKKEIALKLLDNYSEIPTTYYGKLVMRNTKIDILVKNSKKWVQLQDSLEKKKKLMDDIIHA